MKYHNELIYIYKIYAIIYQKNPSLTELELGARRKKYSKFQILGDSLS